MTNAAVPITFKCPPDLVDCLPAPGRGRSRAIVQTLRDKYAHRPVVEWKPTTPRGRRLAALLAAGKKERLPLLTDAQFEAELLERKGRNF